MLILSGKKEVSVHGLHVPETNPGYRYFNPSAAVLDGRTILSLRGLSSERSDANGRFYVLPPNTRHQSSIIIGEFDDVFGCVRQFNVDLDNLATGKPYGDGGGFEDMRLIASPNGTLVGIACEPGPQLTVHADREVTFHPDFRMRISRLDFGPTFQIEKVTTYESPFRRLREKNWAPFHHEGKLCVVYQWNPLILMQLVPDGNTRFLKWFRATPLLKGLRGGSPGIATENGRLFLVHRRFHLEDKLRFTHQFIEFDHSLRPARISDEFVFLSTAMLEYGSGLARKDGKYLVTFGLNDALPFLAQVDEAYVESLLKPFAGTIQENPQILTAPPEEQQTEASVDFPKDPELTRGRLLKLAFKAWIDRRTRGLRGS